MITVHFSNCHEVRMGSPYQIGSLRLEGDWTPHLKERGWQPLLSRSPDERYLCLVEWDTTENRPGFRIVLVDEKQQSVEVSRVILGCCESLTWGEGVIAWKAFPESEGTLVVPFNKPTI
jgi:hypothetical protein